MGLKASEVFKTSEAFLVMREGISPQDKARIPKSPKQDVRAALNFGCPN